MAPRAVRRPPKPVSYLKGLMVSFFALVALLGASNIGLFVNRRTTVPLSQDSPMPPALPPQHQIDPVPQLLPPPLPPQSDLPQTPPSSVLREAAAAPPSSKEEARAARRRSAPLRSSDEPPSLARSRKVAPVEEAKSNIRDVKAGGKGEGEDPAGDVAWCQEAKRRFGVQPGSSWGRCKHTYCKLDTMPHK
jgi:hypothetical protein